MTDLTAAIDAAARALFEHLRNGNFADTEWEQLGPAWQEMWRGAVTAALPQLRRAFAEEASKAIEAHCTSCTDAGPEIAAECEYADAARLVREMGATDAPDAI